MLKRSSRVHRSSKSNSSIRSDCASSPTRGSRLVGLFSITMTRVLGSGFVEQDSRGTRRIRSIKDHVGTSAHGCALAAMRRKDFLSCIRDLSQNRRSFSAGGRWHIRGLTIPCLKGQQSECRCFFRLRGQSEFVGRTNLQTKRPQFICQHCNEYRIAGSATGNDEVAVHALLSHHKSAKGIRNRLGRQRRGRGHDVTFVHVPTLPDELLRELASEFFASGGFRRFVSEEWCTHNVADHTVEHHARACDSAVAIVLFSKQLLHDAINDHVARSSVESDHLIGNRPPRDGCQVRDPADVLHNSTYAAFAI